MRFLHGINPVLEALRAGRVRLVRIHDRSNARIGEVVRVADANGVPVQQGTLERLDRESRHGVHQGVVAEVEDPGSYSVAELVRGASGPPLIVVLDGIEDPQNVGAILRTANAAGVDGVVRQARHAARLDGAAAKASAGAVNHIKIATVINIARTIDELKEQNIWTVGLDGDATESYDEVDYTLPTAFVLGAEGDGLRRLVRETCDRVVGIPMLGQVESLNVSVAAGIALFEAVRQRRAKGR